MAENVGREKDEMNALIDHILELVGQRERLSHFSVLGY